MKKILLLVLTLTYLNVSAQIVDSKMNDDLKYGFIDAHGNWIVPPNYDYASWKSKQKIGVLEKEEKKGLCDRWGKIMVPCQYKWIYVEDKYINVKDMDGKEGILTMEGKVWIPCQYKYIFVEDNYIKVEDMDGNEGLLTKDGNPLIPCQYKSLYVDDDQYIRVEDGNGRKGLYTLGGKLWIPCKYAQISVYNDEDDEVKYILVKDENAYFGFYTLGGNLITDCLWKDYLVYGDIKCIRVENEDKKLGMFSSNGQLIVPCEYDEFKEAHIDGMVMVRKGQKWGFCANGREVVPCVYDSVTPFTNDVATVKKDGEVMLIKNPLKDGTKILIAENTSSSKKKVGDSAISRYPAPDSDVDKDIPVSKRQATNTFAFIIANENYPDAPVPYSLNDGRMFKEYCHKTLGLPEKNINLYEDATFGSIITAVEKMKQIADAYEGEASVIFYYAGHGFPDDKQQTAYLLPIDGDASSITTTGYSLAKLYKEISQLKLKSSIVFLDACFSGAKREDQMLASSRGVAIKVKDEAPQGNMVVFSAAQGDETAHQLEDKHHGLFTYYLLKELQAAGGNVDLGTLTTNVTKQVKRQSVVINNKKQTPTVIPSQSLANSWQNIKLK